MIKNKLLLLLTFIFCFSAANSQIKLFDEVPFDADEEIRYKALYKWGFFKFKAGEVVFSVDTITFNGTKCYHLKGIGNSLPAYDWIFRVRDTFQSMVEIKNFQPLFYKRNTNEGNYHAYNLSYFDYKKDSIFLKLFNSNLLDTSHMVLKLEKNIYDLQTAVYFARKLDFSSAQLDEQFTFNIIIDGILYPISIRYEGLETINVGTNPYQCYKISTEVIEGTIFKENQRINIWVLNDGSQIPIRVEAPIIIGQVKAELEF
jgi:hypothetical protein